MLNTGNLFNHNSDIECESNSSRSEVNITSDVGFQSITSFILTSTNIDKCIAIIHTHFTKSWHLYYDCVLRNYLINIKEYIYINYLCGLMLFNMISRTTCNKSLNCDVTFSIDVVISCTYAYIVIAQIPHIIHVTIYCVKRACGDCNTSLHFC